MRTVSWNSIVLAVLLRVGFFLYGVYQDTHMVVKYTDVDYLVFSDAANYVYNGVSPYDRVTYRYTPLLAWIVLPNSFGGYWYNFGKIVFMICDIITGYIILKLLHIVRGLGHIKAVMFASIWLLNPMVITISTRGSAESVLTVMIMLSVLLLFLRANAWSAVVLGLSIHFKVYPVIYLPSIALYLSIYEAPIIHYPILNLMTKKNLAYVMITFTTFLMLNTMMFFIHGREFLDQTYFYHFIRLDHRHNFSVFNMALYYKSVSKNLNGLVLNNLERIAFLPQLLLTLIFIPLTFARYDLISCLFLQTFAFVTFNKVITTQYFIWFLIFIPHYLSGSKLFREKNKGKGVMVLLLWVVSQSSWLYFAYQLEFMGFSTFDYGLLGSSIFFFLSNCWMLGAFIDDLKPNLVS